MKKVAVFPYDHYFSPLVRNKDNYSDFLISHIFSMQGWGMISESITISNQDDTMDHSAVLDIFDDHVEFDFQELWLIGSDHKLEDKYLYECAELVAKKQKNIIVTRRLEHVQICRLKEISDQYNIKIEFIAAQTHPVEEDIQILYPIDVPLVTVSGIDEKTDKFELQLELKTRLEQDGYHVLWISSREESFLCGEYPFPGFMFSTGNSETKKILMYNHFVKYISTERKPDVILLGIPGGIMPNSKQQVGNFGITAFEVFNAITADFNILAIHCNGNNQEYLDRLLNAMKYKFSVEVDCIHFSSMSQDPFSLNQMTPVEYVLYDNHFTENAVFHLKYDKCPLFHRKSYDKMYDFLIAKLNGYDELQVL